MDVKLAASIERWPLRRPFTISRGSRSEATVVLVTIEVDGFTGRGECAPNERYAESPRDVVRMIEDLASDLASGELASMELASMDPAATDPASMPASKEPESEGERWGQGGATSAREELRRLLPAGAARNGVDAALWDLEAKRSSRRAWEIADLSAPGPVVTAYTLAIDDPAAMATAAEEARDLPLLKVKLGAEGLDGAGNLDRVQAVRKAAPRASLIVDANEAWTLDELRRLAPPLAELGVEMIEQPLPAGSDDALLGLDLPLPVCADESCRDAATVPGLRGKYDAVNVKLDKAGGLTEALATAREARRFGLDLMVGCMLGTSLAMAPALLLAGEARWTDLDGPLLLARDREHALRYDAGRIEPPAPELWG